MKTFFPRQLHSEWDGTKSVLLGQLSNERTTLKTPAFDQKLVFHKPVLNDNYTPLPVLTCSNSPSAATSCKTDREGKTDID